MVTQVQQFYKGIRGKEATPTQSEATHPLLLDVPGLTAELRRYQCEAVSWMLRREGVGAKEAPGESLHVLWQELPVQEPFKTYFNSHTLR
jgi:hypothetical protein